MVSVFGNTKATRAKSGPTHLIPLPGESGEAEGAVV